MDDNKHLNNEQTMKNLILLAFESAERFDLSVKNYLR